MADEVTGAKTLGDAVREAAARKGWKQSELEPRSRDVMASDDDSSRSRIGLSERTWQDIWRGHKTYEMDTYSYATVDRTLGWTRGTAWALHHDQELPTFDHDELEELRAEVEELRAELRGLTELLPSLLGRLGRER